MISTLCVKDLSLVTYVADLWKASEVCTVMYDLFRKICWQATGAAWAVLHGMTYFCLIAPHLVRSSAALPCGPCTYFCSPSSSLNPYKQYFSCSLHFHVSYELDMNISYLITSFSATSSSRPAPGCEVADFVSNLFFSPTQFLILPLITSLIWSFTGTGYFI